MIEKFEETDGILYEIINDNINITGYNSNIITNGIINIPSTINTYNVTNIKSFAFSETTINKVYIPDTIIYIGVGAFNACYNLTEVIINNTSQLEIIDTNAFNSSAIKTINIPDKVTNINNLAFNNCLSLESVYFQGDIPLMGQSAFLIYNAKDNLKGYYNDLESWAYYIFENGNRLDSLLLVNITTAAPISSVSSISSESSVSPILSSSVSPILSSVSSVSSVSPILSSVSSVSSVSSSESPILSSISPILSSSVLKPTNNLFIITSSIILLIIIFIFYNIIV